MIASICQEVFIACVPIVKFQALGGSSVNQNDKKKKKIICRAYILWESSKL